MIDFGTTFDIHLPKVCSFKLFVKQNISIFITNNYTYYLLYVVILLRVKRQYYSYKADVVILVYNNIFDIFSIDVWFDLRKKCTASSNLSHLNKLSPHIYRLNVNHDYDYDHHLLFLHTKCRILDPICFVDYIILWQFTTSLRF